MSYHLHIVTVLPLPTNLNTFSFSYMIGVTRTSNTMLKGSEGWHPCLVPNFRWKTFNFSPLSIILAVCVSWIAFSMLRYVSSILTLVRVLIMKGCWILSDTFFCIHWDDHMVIIFSSVDVVDYMNWFMYVERSFWRWDES